MQHVKLEFRLRIAIRRRAQEAPALAREVRLLRSRGLSTVDALKSLLNAHGDRGGWSRQAAAEVLSEAGAADVTKLLLQQLRRDHSLVPSFGIAAILEKLPSRRGFRGLVRLLTLSRPETAQAAAYHLRFHDEAVPALIGVVGDRNRPSPVREEAAESLGVIGDKRAIPVLLQGLQDESAEVRFWAIFALGQWVKSHKRVRLAIEALVGDEALVREWWRVGQEAKATVTDETLLQAEIREILDNSDASAEDRRWAECYEKD